MKRRISIALVLTLALLAVAITIAVAQPNISLPGRGDRHTFDVTFTKWITTAPEMRGVVGGAVGAGDFEGQILDLKVEGNMEYVKAVYHVNGGKHSFTAEIHATQDDSLMSGVIVGTVTEGWLKGASLYGEYDVLAACNIETPDNSMGTLCFQGVLHVRAGDEDSKSTSINVRRYRTGP